MSMFKNRVTGDITTAFGPVHDNFAARSDEELIFDDREGSRDPHAAPEPAAAPKSSGKQPDISQSTPDVDGVDTSKE